MHGKQTDIKHVILADDDEDDRWLFLQVVSQISSTMKLSFAKDGTELLSFLKTNTPDLVFIDLNMPLLNGVECIREIRAAQPKSELPIIVYSTSSSEKNIEDCYHEGANYYIVKPYSIDKISIALTKVLNKDWNQPVPQSRDQFLIKL